METCQPAATLSTLGLNIQADLQEQAYQMHLESLTPSQSKQTVAELHQNRILWKKTPLF